MELLFTANHRIARNVNIFTCEKGYPSRTYNGDSVFVPVMDNITVRKKKIKRSKLLDSRQLFLFAKRERKWASACRSFSRTLVSLVHVYMWKPRDDGSQHAVRFVVASLFSSSPCIPLPLLMISYGIRGNLMSHTHRDADIVPREARKYLSTEKREKIHDAEVTTIKCIFRYRFRKIKKKRFSNIYRVLIFISTITIYVWNYFLLKKQEFWDEKIGIVFSIKLDI